MVPLIIVLACSAAISCCGSFEFQEATVADMRRAFENGSLTSRRLVEYYLERIEVLNPLLHAVIEVNPDALRQADQADGERRRVALRRPRRGGCGGGTGLAGLHGIPVLLKDLIGTKDRLNTTAGSFALLGSAVPRDAGVVRRLRQAGAVILGKANMAEWANRGPRDNKIHGWSARGGQGRNPYVLWADPCGSSSGSATAAAANMAAVTLGTETDGSMICPAAFNSVVGFKPTVGLTSRGGVIPISPRQDSIGKHGAVLVDNLEIANESLILDPTKSGEMVAVLAEFKVALNSYLSKLSHSPVHSLAEVIAFNYNYRVEEKIDEYSQDFLLQAQSTSGIGAAERDVIAKMNQLSKEGIEKLMMEKRLDAVVAPDVRASSILAIGGYPVISVPAGYDASGKPFGISFGGLKGWEPKLIEIAYGFEQATQVRKPPTFQQYRAM